MNTLTKSEDLTRRHVKLILFKTLILFFIVVIGSVISLQLIHSQTGKPTILVNEALPDHPFAGWYIYKDEVYEIAYPNRWYVYESGYISPDPECTSCGDLAAGFNPHLTHYATSSATLIELAQQKETHDYPNSLFAIGSSFIYPYSNDHEVEFVVITQGLFVNSATDDILMRKVGSQQVYLLKYKSLSNNWRDRLNTKDLLINISISR